MTRTMSLSGGSDLFYLLRYSQPLIVHINVVWASSEESLSHNRMLIRQLLSGQYQFHVCAMPTKPINERKKTLREIETVLIDNRTSSH